MYYGRRLLSPDMGFIGIKIGINRYYNLFSIIDPLLEYKADGEISNLSWSLL